MQDESQQTYVLQIHSSHLAPRITMHPPWKLNRPGLTLGMLSHPQQRRETASFYFSVSEHLLPEEYWFLSCSAWPNWTWFLATHHTYIHTMYRHAAQIIDQKVRKASAKEKKQWHLLFVCYFTLFHPENICSFCTAWPNKIWQCPLKRVQC